MSLNKLGNKTIILKGPQNMGYKVLIVNHFFYSSAFITPPPPSPPATTTTTTTAIGFLLSISYWNLWVLPIQ
jgi:hypothetical protein